MYHYPFSSFSNFYRPTRKDYQSYYNHYSSFPKENSQNIKKKLVSTDNNQSKFNLGSYNDSYFFEFLGIKLFFDDVLLICLIFFLYTEGVKDQYLFIILVLLLLS